MANSLVATRPRGWVLALSTMLFVGIFALRLAVAAPQYSVSILFFVPVVLVAIEYGFIAGVGAALLALTLTQTAFAVTDDELPIASYVSRAIGFLVVGALTGWMAERLRNASVSLREGARHFELSGDLLCSADFDGQFVHLNDAWERTLGWTPEELVGQPFIEFVHPDDREYTLAENAHAIAEGDGTASFTNRYRTKDGSYRWLEWSSRADLESCLIYAVARDVTDRRRAERGEREARERFRRIFDDSFAGIALVGLDGKILEANRGLAAFLGKKPEDLVGRQTLSEYAGSDQLPRIQAGLEKVSTGDSEVYRDEIQVKRSDGRLVWVDLTMSVIRDDDGKPMYRLSQLLDINARKEAEEQLRHLADHDPLSGVFNRRRFEVELELELGHESQHARSSAVLLFDVDNFKQINDNLGHASGDAAIVRLGETLRNQVRTGDAVARLGGDEFAILLRRVDIAGAERIATKIRERGRVALAQAVDSPTPIGLSVGIAMIDGASSASADVILGRADTAMYEAKRLGGDRVVSKVAQSAHADTAKIS
jgi:diguanylate cyclase (GGDEF)-like protein/PAS domain S-box-containing protein